MNERRQIENFLDGSSLEELQSHIETIAQRDPSILGVLAVGSLVQLPTPADFYIPRREGRAAEAYEMIRRPLRRKSGMTKNSDLDIWICTADTDASALARDHVDIGGMALIEELASGTLQKGNIHWRNKKLQAFSRYYKQPDMYPDGLEHGNQPWLAQGFKDELEQALVSEMPHFAHALNSHFTKKVPGEFLEVRAFPQSLFNLRPDEAIMEGGVEDRAPFPRIADSQWISTEHNAYVFYATDELTIYPFVKNGEVLGSAIGNHIDALAERERKSVSLGGIMLKPDAFSSGQLPIIREKIHDMLKRHNGKIVLDEYVTRLDHDDIKGIYPLLDVSDRNDVKEYLQSGPVEIIIIEMPCGPYDVFKLINATKGARIGERTNERLREGRKTDGTIRDLLPLPGDEDKYKKVIETVLKKRIDPTIRFDDEDYKYYVKNLMHTPDNSVELNGLIDIAHKKEEGKDERSED